MTFTSIRFVDKNKDKALFFSTLRKRVDCYFRENKLSRHHNPAMITKTVILLSAYILPFVALLVFTPPFWVALILWGIMGMGLAGVGMSVMHDANHGAYSSSHKTNYWLGHTLNLLGGSVFNWKMQHNVMHHTYTNIVHYDDDIADKLILKFNPHTEVKWYHKLQVAYAFLFYGITTLYWSVLKDFVQFRKYTRMGINTCCQKENKIVFLKILLSKIGFWTAMFVVPVFLFHIPFYQVLLGFLFMEFISGVILTVIFQLAHTVEGTSHPLPNEDLTIENNWAVHQMNTTVNFSRNCKWLSWYVGGLNFQVEHHLFPNICHVHYPAISEIVKSTAEEFGVPYLENESFGAAIRSHLNAIIRFGKMPEMSEAIS